MIVSERRGCWRSLKFDNADDAIYSWRSLNYNCASVLYIRNTAGDRWIPFRDWSPGRMHYANSRVKNDLRMLEYYLRRTIGDSGAYGVTHALGNIMSCVEFFSERWREKRRTEMHAKCGAQLIRQL